MADDHDVLAELDNIKVHVEENWGKEEPSTTVTALSRFEEQYAAFRSSLEEVLALEKTSAGGEE